MNSQREKFLLFRIRKFQDQLAFAELYKEYKPSLYRFIRSRLARPEDAEDISDTVFMRAWSFINASHTSDKDHFSGLIFHIARNCLIDYYRANKWDVSLAQLEESGYTPPDKINTAASVTAGAELALIKDILPRLTPEHQDVIVLRLLEGLEWDEVAKRMEKTVNAARVTLHRALKELRKYL